MLKNSELPKLPFKKILLPVSVLVILIVLSIVICAAGVSKTVNIYEGESTEILKTKKSLVSEVLDEKGITLNSNDEIVPSLDSQIIDNMDINIYRAVTVTIKENENTKQMLLAGANVESVLQKAGIILGEFDYVIPAKTESITANMEIVINRAMNVSIFANGEEKIISTVKKTVGELINEQGITLSDRDRLNYEPTATVFDGMKIELITVNKEVIEVTETVQYESIKKPVNSLEKGKTRTVQEGKNGTRKAKYEITYENGVEKSRKLISSSIITKPVNAITEYGTLSVTTTSRGESFRYTKVLKFSASAYDLSYESCGKSPGDRGYGITASGMKATYGVVAVDPGVIPLGTRLYVEAYDGHSWTYGYCVAGDTGGNIRGNRIDLFFNSRAEAKQFGRRTANVYILE